MTKAELEQYRSIVAEITELKKMDCIDWEDVYYSVMRDIEKLTQRKNAIDTFINSIKDLKLKRIFKERYIIGNHQPSFQAIASKMGYSDEGTPRKKIKKYLELSENSETDMI